LHLRDCNSEILAFGIQLLCLKLCLAVLLSGFYQGLSALFGELSCALHGVVAAFENAIDFPQAIAQSKNLS
jgi:hypothetical protein